MGNKYLDKDGTQVLVSELLAKVDAKINEAMAYPNSVYGIEKDMAISTPECTRIGNLSLHKTLPVQSQMKGCVLRDSGEIYSYLRDDNWLYDTTSRDGSSGQVMVELPDVWMRFEQTGTKIRVLMSAEPVPGFTLWPKCYVSAYEASLDRTNLKLASVLNKTAQYRGGDNNGSWDGTYRSLLNRPVTSLNRTQFREYARKRKANSTEWNCMTYDVQKRLYWLFVVEYATLNSQAEYKAALTAEGYRQGGLGDGVTTLSDAEWSKFNNYLPFVPCGTTDSLGNKTGVVNYTIDNKDTSNPIKKTVAVPRYRGIENPFGHVWQWTDGINIRISPDVVNRGDGLSKVFVCSDPAKFNDKNYEGYSYIGNEARTNGFVKNVIFGERGEIMSTTVGSGSTIDFCDYHYTSIPTTVSLRGVLFGGFAAAGSRAGFAFAASYGAPSYSSASIGSRLCFSPATA